MNELQLGGAALKSQTIRVERTSIRRCDSLRDRKSGWLLPLCLQQLASNSHFILTGLQPGDFLLRKLETV
jgi:hypothetical protein